MIHFWIEIRFTPWRRIFDEPILPRRCPDRRSMACALILQARFIQGEHHEIDDFATNPPLVLIGLLCTLGLAQADEAQPKPLPPATPAQIQAELRAVLLRINVLSYYLAPINQASTDTKAAITVKPFECGGSVPPNSSKPWPPKEGDAVDTESLTRVLKVLIVTNNNLANGQGPTAQDLCVQ